MKKVIIIVSSILISQLSLAQTEFQANVAKVLRFVERNIDIKNEVNKDCRLDFFVYDISLDAKGNITDIHLLILDSVRVLLTINHTAEAIYKKVYIPVMIVYRNEEDQENDKYVPLLNTIKFFESLGKSQKKDVFVSRVATISTFQKK